MAATSTFSVVMNNGLAFNRFGDVVLRCEEGIDGLVDGKPSVRTEISLPRGAFGAYLRDNIPGYSAKCQSLAKDEVKGTALVQRLFSVALESATVTITAHHHKAGEACGNGDAVYTKDGFHYTVDDISGIPDKVIATCAVFAADALDAELFG